MIAVDTNILVHAHRSESPWHSGATAALVELSREAWAIPWPCVHEFLAITTHPRIFDPPTPLPDALSTVDGWLVSSGLLLVGERSGYWELLGDLVTAAGVTGPRVHDARIAAICLLHGVSEIWTVDRDFSRFPRLRARNPLGDPR